MAEHFYDGQIRKYLVQMMRLFSNFSYQTGDGTERQVPVLYGDLTRQVGSILRDNSENKIPSAPRMAVYITGLELDRDRTSDSSYVNKRHIRERAKDGAGDYTDQAGKQYTVERLMPTPYKLTVNVDLWSTNTDMKLQIMEQILMLFNPSLDIQTTDNYLDWTSLTTIMLDSVNFSSRSIPTGVDSEIDVGSMTFSTPIYISPPAKVKRLGVITNIVTSIFDGDGYVDFEQMLQGTNLFSMGGMTETVVQDTLDNTTNVVDTGKDPNAGYVLNEETGKYEWLDPDGLLEPRKQKTRHAKEVVKSYTQHRVLILNGQAQILKNGLPSNIKWGDHFDALLGSYRAGLSIAYFRKPDINGMLAGRITVNPLDETKLTIDFDKDTLPSNSTVQGPARNANQHSSVDYIIDPLRYDPTTAKVAGLRLLLLGSIGNQNYEDFNAEKLYKLNNIVYYRGYHYKYTRNTYNTQYPAKIGILPTDTNYWQQQNVQDGADSWKNTNGTDFVASSNDIIEWDGTAWQIVFDASADKLIYNDEVITTLYTTNLNTGIQYYWDGDQWLLSVDGEYAKGDWSIKLDG